MRKVIVTGANGFIGCSLIRKLLSENVKVFALDLSFEELRLLVNDNLVLVEDDLSNVENCIRKISENEFDVFYHLAWRGVNGDNKTDPLIQIGNIRSAVVAVGVAKQLKCEKFLCSGTIAEQAVKSLHNLSKTSGGMTYGVAKHCTRLILETYCKNIDLPFVWMQFSNIYGPKNRTGNLVSYTIDELRKDKNVAFGPANQWYDFIYIDDLIEAVYRIGFSENHSDFYFVGSGEMRKLKEYLYEIGTILSKRDKIKIGERPDDGIVYRKEMFDISTLINDIGSYVSVSFTDGIMRTIYCDK